MSEVGESAGAAAGQHVEDECPFCPLQKKQQNITSYIGKDNDSKALGRNLEASGDRKQDHLYVDSDHGTYSAEAHHVICGKEVLGEEGQLERFLIKDDKTTTNDAGGLLQPHDVGYDVNCAENGIWLPSVPFQFMAGKKAPERWWGDQTTWNKNHPRRRKRKSLTAEEKDDIAFTVMAEVQRQFHKGPHGSVGEPHNNYVVMAISRLRQLTVYVKHFADICPMDDDGKPKTDPPFYPPHGVIHKLNSLSGELKKELQGAPETWNYFISRYALDCAAYWKL